jgi:S-adenosyl-L-methionine hydrolase (adenosine-forming)
LRNQKIRSVREITNQEFFQHPVSRTFHGRDIFAPTAAHLVAGKKFSLVGPVVKDWVPLPWPTVQQSEKTITGEIIYIDHFGNAITSLSADLLPESRWKQVKVVIKRHKLGNPQSSYAAVKTGQPLVVLSSAGFLEIAVRDGSAAELLKLKLGDKVTVSIPGFEVG